MQMNNIYNYILTLLILLLYFSSIKCDCNGYNSCSSCVGAFGNNDNCVWCKSQKTCVREDQVDQYCSGSYEDTCDNNMYTVIFAIVLSGICCFCCSTWLLRKYAQDRMRNRGINSGLRQGLLARTDDPHEVFRNSLIDEGEDDWLCPICGFSNYPRAKNCALCGTDKTFSINYFREKSLEMLLQKKNQKNKEHSHHLISSINVFDRNINTDKKSLSESERTFSFNLGRLNKLTQRQKRARRRHIWKREIDENGELVWIRAKIPIKSGIAHPNHNLDYNNNNNNNKKKKKDKKNWMKNTKKKDNKRYDSIENFKNDDDDDIESNNNNNNNNINLEKKEMEYDIRDSFNDATMISSSPGFLSVLGSTKDDIEWAEVNENRSGRRKTHSSSMHIYIPSHDLSEIASKTFREKHLWFVEQLTKIQKPWSAGHIRLEIDREFLLKDSFEQFNSLNSFRLQEWMRVTFLNEPGVDAGGIEREWFTLVCNEIFDPNNGFFERKGEGGTYTINSLSFLKNQLHLEYFQFIGRFLAKALMERQTIDARLALPIFKHLLGVPITFSDLELIDPEIYRNLLWVKNNSPESLEIYFTVNSHDPLTGKMIEVELKENGKDILVTDDNKSEFLYLHLKYAMLDSVKDQLYYFLKGFYETIPPDIISVFDYQELELLLCGIPVIDVQDWRRHTQYLGEYSEKGENHQNIKWFWFIVNNYSEEEKARLLQFCTGTSKVPAQGFKTLQSNDGVFRLFNITSISKTDSTYPRAHTCFNKLDLPLYSSLDEMSAYLSVVINMETIGFSMD